MVRLAGASVLVSSGTLLAAAGAGQAAVTGGALFYLASSVLAIGAFFLLTEHTAHLFGALPWLLLLACPLMHLFMHSGHGHGGHVAGCRHRVEATQAERQDRCGRAGRVLGVARGPGRAPQDRRGRYWLHTSPVGAHARGRHPAGQVRVPVSAGMLVAGANVVAAIRVAQQLGPGTTVVTLMVDSGLKYLNTDVYRSR